MRVLTGNQVLRGTDSVCEEKDNLWLKRCEFIESYSAEGGHSAHCVCTNHNPTQALSPNPMHFPQLVPLTLSGNLVRPIHLTRTSLEGGRKPEHPEETHADMGRMCKLELSQARTFCRIFQPRQYGGGYK